MVRSPAEELRAPSAPAAVNLPQTGNGLHVGELRAFDPAGRSTTYPVESEPYNVHLLNQGGTIYYADYAARDAQPGQPPDAPRHARPDPSWWALLNDEAATAPVPSPEQPVPAAHVAEHAPQQTEGIRPNFLRRAVRHLANTAMRIRNGSNNTNGTEAVTYEPYQGGDDYSARHARRESTELVHVPRSEADLPPSSSQLLLNGLREAGYDSVDAFTAALENDHFSSNRAEHLRTLQRIVRTQGRTLRLAGEQGDQAADATFQELNGAVQQLIHDYRLKPQESGDPRNRRAEQRQEPVDLGELLTATRRWRYR